MKSGHAMEVLKMLHKIAVWTTYWVEPADAARSDAFRAIQTDLIPGDTVNAIR